MTHAIERIGYGKHTRYTIKAYAGNGSIPTNGKAYRTEQAAREAAHRLGVTITACGDLWEILAAIK